MKMAYNKILAKNFDIYILFHLLIIMVNIFGSSTSESDTFPKTNFNLSFSANFSTFSNSKHYEINAEREIKLDVKLMGLKKMFFNKPASNATFTLKSKRNAKQKMPKVLTILGLFELSFNHTLRRESGQSEMVAAQMALDDINANPKILQGYKLVMHTNDTQCDPGSGVDAFFHALYSRKNSNTKIISVLGTACSEVTQRVSKVATHQKILQVSFGAMSASLSDRKEFPLFYRTVAPVSSHSQAIIELITHFNWDTVSFFTENENRFTMPVNHLVKEFEEKGNITCKATLTFSLSDFQDQLKELKDLDSRIIIASFGTYVAPLVFCEAYKLGIFGKDYAWIWIGGKPDTLWWRESTESSSNPFFYSKPRRTTHHYTNNDNQNNNMNMKSHNASNDAYLEKKRQFFRMRLKRDGDNDNYKKRLPIKGECSLRQLTEAIESTLVVDRYNILDRGRISDFGLTTEAFSKRLRAESDSLDKTFPSTTIAPLSKKENVKEKKDSLSHFAPETYDAVWTVALGLHNIKQKYNYALEHFNYKDELFSRHLNEEIGKLEFIGISGPITFSGSDRIGITSFMQVQGGILYQVGLFHPDRVEPELKLELWKCNSQNASCRSIQWPGNQVPIARREFRIKLISVEKSLYIFILTVAILGILLAVSFLAFNLYYRKLKYIKLSSPNLNNMMIIGCIFAYVAVIILGADFVPKAETDVGNEQRFSYICTIRAYLLSTAFSLAFGSMFAKTYRVHRIFTRSCIGVVKNKLLKDTQLMTLVMALLLIDVIIVTSWAIFDPMHRHLRNLTLQMDPSDRSVVYQPQIEVCRSEMGHVWLGVMYGYKSLLLVVGIYMAWETRRVKIQALNDSKNIAYCVYIVVLTSVLAVSLANLISDRVTLSFVSVTLLILTSTTVTLCLLFLPKIHAIKTGRHKGDPVVESMGLKIEFNTRRLVVEDAKELMFRAEVQNRVFKRQIEAIDVEIWRLENLLLCSSQSSLVSMEDGTKKMGKKGSEPSKESDRDPAEATSLSSTEEASEIYTVYLHGPRFIVPISVLNFQNPNASDILPSLSLAVENDRGRYKKTGKQMAAALTSLTAPTTSSSLQIPPPPPRSSWPNVRSLLAPNSLISKIQFKSEPRLLIEEIDPNRHQKVGSIQNQAQSFLLSPKVTFGESDNEMTGSKANVSKGDGRKGSNFLSMLKQPFTYFSEMVKVRSSSEGYNSTSTNPKGRDGNNYNFEDEGPQIFHLNVPRDSIRQKFNSVPDLWAVRTSPVFHHYPKKTSVMSDSVVDTSCLHALSFNSEESGTTKNGLSTSNPILELTVTSHESSYL